MAKFENSHRKRTCRANMSRLPRRIALTIGNDSYHNLRTLRNAASDAGAIAKIMRRAGFTTTARSNLGRLELGRAVGLFVNQLRDGGVGVFWFSGHGMQLHNKNLLLPIDARYNSGFGMNEEGLFLDHLLERATEVRAKTVIAFVDACRDNPFGHGMTRSAGLVTQGLQAPAAVPSGFMVIYSAGSNQVALDNLGPDDTHPHGLFTRELLPLLTRPGYGIDQAVRQAREQVRAKALAVGFQQVPSIYDQLDGCFYLVPSALGNSTANDHLDDHQHTGIIAPVISARKPIKTPKKQADDKFSVVRGRDGTPDMLAQLACPLKSGPP